MRKCKIGNFKTHFHRELNISIVRIRGGSTRGPTTPGISGAGSDNSQALMNLIQSDRFVKSNAAMVSGTHRFELILMISIEVANKNKG